MCIRDRFRGVSKARDAEASASYSDTGAGDQGMMFGYACTDTCLLYTSPEAIQSNSHVGSRLENTPLETAGLEAARFC